MLQSTIVVSLQILLLYQVVKNKRDAKIKLLESQDPETPAKPVDSTFFKLAKLLVPLFLAFLLFLIPYILVDSDSMTITTGYLAGLIETFCPLPQILKVIRHRSVVGLRSIY